MAGGNRLLGDFRERHLDDDDDHQLDNKIKQLRTILLFFKK